jgi:hypothetical protein
LVCIFGATSAPGSAVLDSLLQFVNALVVDGHAGAHWVEVVGVDALERLANWRWSIRRLASLRPSQITSRSLS